MNLEQRHKRLRRLIKNLNRERKLRAKKVDILCNDLIAAHRDFIKRLDSIGFTAHFYESILGTAELNGLFYNASGLIKEEVPDVNLAFFLRQADSFELHMFESERPIGLEKQHLENCFTPELVESICQSNKICTLEDMFSMGLEGNLTELNKISAVTIPLGIAGVSLGFILIYRPSENKLTTDELKNVLAITGGLSRAIQSCKVLSKQVH